jgi:putative transcription antitermination factor YqgF
MKDVIYIGLDYGKTKIGLAYSEGDYASPLGSIANTPSRLSQMQEKLNTLHLPEKYTITIIFGIPQSILDTEIYKFSDEVKAQFKCAVAYEDETFTTQEALENMIASDIGMKKRRKDDAAAAVIILQRFLDNKKIAKE